MILSDESTRVVSAFSGADPYVHDQETWDMILFEMNAVALNPPADPGYRSDEDTWTEPAGLVGNRCMLVRLACISLCPPVVTPAVTPVKSVMKQSPQAGSSSAAVAPAAGSSPAGPAARAKTNSPVKAAEIAGSELVKRRKL